MFRARHFWKWENIMKSDPAVSADWKTDGWTLKFQKRGAGRLWPEKRWRNKKKGKKAHYLLWRCNNCLETNHLLQLGTNVVKSWSFLLIQQLRDQIINCSSLGQGLYSVFNCTIAQCPAQWGSGHYYNTNNHNNNYRKKTRTWGKKDKEPNSILGPHYAQYNGR